MILLLAIQRQIPDLARIPGELTHFAELLPIRFYLELVGLQTFHRVNHTLSVNQPPKGRRWRPRLSFPPKLVGFA
jgi:hypothetical protein